MTIARSTQRFARDAPPVVCDCVIHIFYGHALFSPDVCALAFQLCAWQCAAFRYQRQRTASSWRPPECVLFVPFSENDVTGSLGILQISKQPLPLVYHLLVILANKNDLISRHPRHRRIRRESGPQQGLCGFGKSQVDLPSSHLKTQSSQIRSVALCTLRR